MIEDMFGEVMMLLDDGDDDIIRSLISGRAANKPMYEYTTQ
jgi:hypothetical protein